MNKVLKIICFPIVILPMYVIAYIMCIMTWGLTGFKYNFDWLWNNYWNKQGK